MITICALHFIRGSPWNRIVNFWRSPELGTLSGVDWRSLLQISFDGWLSQINRSHHWSPSRSCPFHQMRWIIWFIDISKKTVSFRILYFILFYYRPSFFESLIIERHKPLTRLLTLSVHICIRIARREIKRCTIRYSSRSPYNFFTKRSRICRDRGTHTWGINTNNYIRDICQSIGKKAVRFLDSVYLFIFLWQ